MPDADIRIGLLSYGVKIRLVIEGQDYDVVDLHVATSSTTIKVVKHSRLRLADDPEAAWCARRRAFAVRPIGYAPYQWVTGRKLLVGAEWQDLRCRPRRGPGLYRRADFARLPADKQRALVAFRRLGPCVRPILDPRDQEAYLRPNACRPSGLRHSLQESTGRLPRV
jgi:hypothetical protein